MSNLILRVENGQPVVTSRQIAGDFEKEHKHVLDGIDSLVKGVAEKSADLFIPTEYQHEQNKQTYREYLLTRDGFSLLVMGFTGAKALEWKLKYIEAFNKMEQTLKEQNKPTCIEDVLITSLQEMKDMRLQLQETKAKVEIVEQKAIETKEELQGIREVVSINSTDWKKDTATLISKIALKLGGFEHTSDLRKESYNLLHQKTGVKLETRLTNKRRRMADEGVCKSKRDKLNYIDIIAEDKKELEVYLGIVKEMAIKYGI